MLSAILENYIYTTTDDNNHYVIGAIFAMNAVYSITDVLRLPTGSHVID